jgi:hypothetical protein
MLRDLRGGSGFITRLKSVEVDMVYLFVQFSRTWEPMPHNAPMQIGRKVAK